MSLFFFFQAEDGIRDWSVTGVQTCALPISAEVAGAFVGLDHNPARSRPKPLHKPSARLSSILHGRQHRNPVLTVTVSIYADRVVPVACRRLAWGGRASRAGDGITTA